ncbi:putative RNA-binding protein [Leptomonas pyrrhocoris]|uniref:Putative RNA-binding protein n=1 Tax=Leptomonas pyrrhocoris TaxID=157538 RepID=A0A0M9FY19_LEPPY|nr:putative RNA-binding protein [Leptomonas pyrrhocoris]KPA78460.1 putative RNA-binding protein [Leptomonas pyrrhocoris]|eukprot:XP_015656899.1 putative RNA-binding protein [Leptomonas pyrrhocoris]
MAGVPSQSRFGCYIGNIDRSVTIDMLKQVFCQCGTIVDCSLNGREGDPYRFGFIDFVTEDDRSRALKYNGFTLVGRKLKVGISKGNVNKPEGYANGNPGGGGAGHNSDRSRQPYSSSGGSNNYRGGGGGGDGGGAGGMNAGGLTTQQQIEARLLLQFLQEGKMDPRQLSPAQQQLLIASLGQGSANGSGSGTPMDSSNGAPSMMGQQPSMGNPMMPMMGGMNAMMMTSPNMHMGGGGGNNSQMMMGTLGQGGYGGSGMMPPLNARSPQPWGYGMQPGGGAMYPSPPMMGGGGQQTPPQQLPPSQPQPQTNYGASGAGVLSGGAAGQGYGLAPGAGGLMVNAPPSAETLRLREKQREQFFEVVRKDTEKYERKLQEKKAQAAAGGGGEHSDSSASDDDEKPAKKSKKETPSGK